MWLCHLSIPSTSLYHDPDFPLPHFLCFGYEHPFRPLSKKNKRQTGWFGSLIQVYSNSSFIQSYCTCLPDSLKNTEDAVKCDMATDPCMSCAVSFYLHLCFGLPGKHEVIQVSAETVNQLSVCSFLRASFQVWLRKPVVFIWVHLVSIMRRVQQLKCLCLFFWKNESKITKKARWLWRIYNFSLRINRFSPWE